MDFRFLLTCDVVYNEYNEPNALYEETDRVERVVDSQEFPLNWPDDCVLTPDLLRDCARELAPFVLRHLGDDPFVPFRPLAEPVWEYERDSYVSMTLRFHYAPRLARKFIDVDGRLWKYFPLYRAYGLNVNWFGVCFPSRVSKLSGYHAMVGPFQDEVMYHEMVEYMCTHDVMSEYWGNSEMYQID